MPIQLERVITPLPHREGQGVGLLLGGSAVGWVSFFSFFHFTLFSTTVRVPFFFSITYDSDWPSSLRV